MLELPGVYPNGIAFDARQRLYWTESMTHRVRRLDDGKPVTFCQLPDSHVPDGMAFASDGRLFVATTVSQGVTVISPDGAVLGEITLGEHATNCAFDGSDLYVTATREADIEASQRTGTFWRVETDATGLELIPGRLLGIRRSAVVTGSSSGIGRAHSKPLLETSDDDFDAIIAVNLRGPFLLCRAAVRQMLTQPPRGGARGP